MISEFEKRILISLNQDARKSYRKVAKEAGVSTTRIYNAIKKLVKNGIIKGYIPLIDPKYLGYNLSVVIALRANQGNDKDVQEIISKYPHVRTVYKITGEWDYILICCFEGLEDLDYFLINQLSLPQVQRVISHVVLNVVKDDKRTLVLEKRK